MNQNPEYTQESIYDEIGRVNATAIISLKPGTEEYEKYGHEMVGTFLYSNRERGEMVKIIKESNGESKTHGKIRFKYNDEEGVDSDHIIELRRFGISTESIARLYFLNPPYAKDAYAEEGIKEIPHQITIPFEPGPPSEYVGMMTGLYSRKRKDGWSFLNEEIAEYVGLEMLYKDNSAEELIAEYDLRNKPEVMERVEYYHLRAKYWLNKKALTQEELKRCEVLSRKDWTSVFDCFKAEAGEIVDDPQKFFLDNVDLAVEAVWQSHKFSEGRLVQSEPPIWWDAKSYAHIMFRHGFEFDNEFDKRTKTRFQYERKEAVRVIEIVCDMVHDEFKAHEGEVFYREGLRAVEYNGNHYCLRIEKSGRLMQFYPYEKE